MNTLRKLLLLWIVLAYAQIQFIQQLADTGLMICLLKNLPHRGLGMLYSASVIQPDREEFQLRYLSEYAIVRDENRMLEGMTQPTIAFQAITLAKFHPDNRQIKFVTGLIVQQERERLAAQRK